MLMVDGASEEAQVIQVTGEIDVASSPGLEMAINAVPSRRPIVVRLDTCDYCDSSVLSILVRAWKSRAPGFAIVAGADGVVAKILHISGLNDVLPVFLNTASALTHVRSLET